MHHVLTPKGERYVADSNVLVAFKLRQPLFAVPGITEREVRKAVAAEIDRLIELMDAFDGDCDLEDNADDEPSIIGSNPPYTYEVDLEGGSWSEAGSRRGYLGWTGHDDDTEDSLGWTGAINQAAPMTFEGRSRVACSVADGEQDAGDDREADEDSEAVNEDGGDINDDPHDSGFILDGYGTDLHATPIIPGGGSEADQHEARHE